MPIPDTTSHAACVIVGAGIAGLMCARALDAAGVSTIVVDKARGVGGRCSTRRDGDARFDHGAQYCTARDARFDEIIKGLAVAGRVRTWFDLLPRPDGVAAPETDPTERWVGIDGMSSIPKALAEDLSDVRTRRRVRRVAIIEGDRSGPRWRIELDSETAPVTDDSSHGDTVEVLEADCVVWTPPVPQTLMILDTSDVTLPHDVDERLRAVRYLPCCTVMVRPSGPVRLDPPGGFAPMQGPVAWIADNNRKGVSDSPSVTIQATGEWSARHFDDDDDAVVDALVGASRTWLPEDPAATVVHRWRFATPGDGMPGDVVRVDTPAPAVFGGDAFAGGRVEGAAVSGLRAAEEVQSILEARDRSA